MKADIKPKRNKEMRPEKLYRLTRKAFSNWLKNGDNRLFVSLLPSIEKQWLKHAKYENDYRNGNETYGYADKESIQLRRCYISDRFQCAFRLKWLIDGLKSGKI